MSDFKRTIKSVKRRYAAIPLLLALVGGLVGTTVAPIIASADSPANLTVQTSPQVPSLGSANIHILLQQGTPSSSYAVTVQVSAPAGAGGPFCQTVTVATNGGGNGWAEVEFPGTFLASACSPVGMGGPSTYLSGNYTVTVSSVPATTARTLSTTFTVQAPPYVVSGTGTSSTQTTALPVAFIPAAGSTAANPLYVSCTGTTTSPTTTTAPYYISQVGSTELTGIITSNTPGQIHTNNLRNPCNPNSTATFVSTSTNFYTFDNVTVTLPNGRTAIGGLMVTFEGGATSLTTTSGTTTTTVGNGQYHFTLTGFGGLRGVTGLGLSQATVVTVGSSATGIAYYWVQLTFSNYDQ